MHNPFTTAWTALTTGRGWSRLELDTTARAGAVPDAEERSTDTDTTEMRRYLAVQTSQVL